MLCVLVLLVAAGLCSAQDAELGKRIYSEGILPSGRPVEGTNLQCAACHRKSGFGSTEGGTLVPPVTGPSLYHPTELRQADLFSRLFEEGQPVQARVRLWHPPVRPAYTDQTLAVALREGKDPTGRELDQVMPRYLLSDKDVGHLVAYLKSLSSTPAPGVDTSVIHFATVVTEGANAAKREAMLDVMNAYFRRKNADTQRELQRRGRSVWLKDDFYRAYRDWVLHVWELKGRKDTWRDQLETHYREQPVFALLGGIGRGSWQPVHEFCEREQVPCLFPNTDLPEVSPTGDYSVYFSKGLTGEAEALARYFHDHSEAIGTMRIIQVYREVETGLVPARALRLALQNHGIPLLQDKIIGDAQNLTPDFWKDLFQNERPSALVVWLEDADLDSLPFGDAMPRIYISYSLVKDPSLLRGPRDKIYLTYPFALPNRPAPQANRARAWLRSRGLTRKDERTQFNTYFVLELVDYSLTHLVENFSQDYFIETIERETETTLNPGVYPHLSLGPGQRFASKGSYIVRLSDVAEGRVEAVSDWIIP